MIAAPNRFRRNQIMSDMRHGQVDRAHLKQSHATVHRSFGVLILSLEQGRRSLADTHNVVAL